MIDQHLLRKFPPHRARVLRLRFWHLDAADIDGRLMTMAELDGPAARRAAIRAALASGELDKELEIRSEFRQRSAELAGWILANYPKVETAPIRALPGRFDEAFDQLPSKPDLTAVRETYEAACLIVRSLESALEHTEPPEAPTPSDDRPGGAKAPSETAIQCYRLMFLRGDTSTQKETAKAVYGHEKMQYQVSRDVKAVKEWIEAGNVLPDLDTDSPRPKTFPVDPAKLDRGARPQGTYASHKRR